MPSHPSSSNDVSPRTPAADDAMTVYGHTGAVAGHVSAAEWAGKGSVVTLTLADGRHVFVERDRLQTADGGHLEFHGVQRAAGGVTPNAAARARREVTAEANRHRPPANTAIRYEGGGGGGTVEAGQRAVIPVVEEEAVVAKRAVKRATVRVHRRVRTQEKHLDVPLTVEEVKVERVPADRVVDAMEPPRTEGETTIVPVYEEVLVVQRKFRLKEEVHLTRVRTQRPSTHTVTLRRHEVQVERVALPEVGNAAKGE